MDAENCELSRDFYSLFIIRNVFMPSNFNKLFKFIPCPPNFMSTLFQTTM